MDDKRFSLKKCLNQGMTWLVVILISVLFAFLLFKWDSIHALIGKILSILAPVIFGLVIAYVLHPVVEFAERMIVRIPALARMKNEKKAEGLARAFSVGFALVLMLVVLFALGYLIVPQLISSISEIIDRLPTYSRELVNWIDDLSREGSPLGSQMQRLILQASTYLQHWMESTLYPQVWTIVNNFTSSIMNIVSFCYNLIIGMIISIYVLISKDKFTGQAKKTVFAIFHPETANAVIDVFRRSNQIFGGFISGKLIDSAIIGVLCFLVMYIINMPFAVLVSVIVGVTNIIPFFGPYIGAVPSVILITLVDPKQGIIFLIFIIILQQFDGNILGPKILGDSTGLSAFWVVFAILLGGGLFGFPGMLLGVPVFAVIYYLVKTGVEYLLYKRHMPMESKLYENVAGYDPVNKTMVYLPENESRKEKKERVSSGKNLGIERDRMKRKVAKKEENNGNRNDSKEK